MDYANIADAFYTLTLAIIGILTALGYLKQNKIETIATVNQSKLNTIDTAQTAQMVSQGQAQVATPAPAQYYTMTDAAKSFNTAGMTDAQKASYLAQVALNESLKNVRYTVSVEGLGVAVIENGCQIEDAFAYKGV